MSAARKKAKKKVGRSPTHEDLSSSYKLCDDTPAKAMDFLPDGLAECLAWVEEGTTGNDIDDVTTEMGRLGVGPPNVGGTRSKLLGVAGAAGRNAGGGIKPGRTPA